MKPQPNGRPWKVEADLIYRDVNSVHDMVINEESGFAYPWDRVAAATPAAAACT